MTSEYEPDTHVLLVEDDAAARMVTADTLEGAGYIVVAAADGEKAIAMLEQQRFAVVVTDIRMGTIDGIEVLKAARSQTYRPAVILLTGYGSLETAIAALRMGACDYLLKPCAPDMLLNSVARAMKQRNGELQQASAMDTIIQIAARVQEERNEEPSTEPLLPSASQRKTEAGTGQVDQPVRYLRIGELSIDSFRHEVRLNGKPLHMTRIEYALLYCLAESQGRVLTYSEIVRHTHGQTMDESEALLLLKQHIRNIRSKIPSEYLINVRSTGYMLVDPDESGA